LSSNKSVYNRKVEIRQKILRRRNSLSSNEIHAKSGLIQRHLLKCSEYNSAAIVGFYYPIGSEVRTEDVINNALQNGKIVGLPKISCSRDPEIYFHKLSVNRIDLKDLTDGKFGTKEPVSDLRLHRLDLTVLPGSVFDKNGYRLGYGRGFYDRFLSKKSCSMSIGLAFEMQVVTEELPHSSLDQKIDALVTEKGTMRF
jgi:5-formyltetrahydrofolate cyclo-ligase